MRGLLFLYGDCLRQTGRALRRSPWTLFWPVGLFGIFLPASALLAPMGFVGGILGALLLDALLASFLYVVSELVRGSPVKLQEMPQSVKHYFWPIMNVLFVLWIARLLLSFAVPGQANSPAFSIALSAVLFILLNAVPEVIYLRGTYGGLASIGESIGFVQNYWLEWLVPNLAFGALLYFGLPRLIGVLPLPYPLNLVAFVALGGGLAHVAMVFRGFLFQGVDGTTRRQRELRARLGR